MATLRGILTGLGGRGRSWFRVCQKSADAELVAFVEPNESQQASFVSQYGVARERVFSSLDDAVGRVGADFVLDVTPPVIHEQVAAEAFAAGLHVLGEKPLSDDFSAAKRMVQAGEDAGCVHMVAQNYRFAPLPRTAHRIVDAGTYGKPEQVVVGFYKEWAHASGTHYTTMPYPLLTDMGVHHFDLLRYVLGREPVRVEALSWNPSWGWHAGDAGHVAKIDFEGGLVAVHHALGSSIGKQSPWNGEWRIESSQGSLTWEDDRLFYTRVHPKEEATREEIPLDSLEHSGQDAVLVEFCRAVQENREPECSGRDNLKTLALTLAAVQSAKEKRPVEIEAFLAG